MSLVLVLLFLLQVYARIVVFALFYIESWLFVNYGCRQDSFVRAQQWVRELQSQCNNPNIVIALAGNKSDLAASHRAVERQVLFFHRIISLFLFLCFLFVGTLAGSELCIA